MTIFGELRSFFRIDLKILPESLSVKSGEESPDPTAPDSAFIRISTPYGTTVYLPGSSIKGVFRSYSESLLKSLGKDVCGLMLGNRNNSDCGGKEAPGRNRSIRLDKSNDFTTRYSRSCYACRTFGSTALGSVIRFDDFFPYRIEDSAEVKTKKIQQIQKYLSTRHGIKVDRKSGSVTRGALYDVEVLSGGELFGSVYLKNPELWQLVLIFKTIDDINNGFQKFGGMKSRGLGRVRIEITGVEIISKCRNGIVFSRFSNNKFDEQKITTFSILKTNDSFPPFKYSIDKNMVETFISETYHELRKIEW